ncbi:hypothetical protein BY996DRAFT_6425272 [Phakopsora pachyrhizi]|nr:hypothetical protein BY996DRAFT_6425272 [Phakopsora pachyrhizi]
MTNVVLFVLLAVSIINNTSSFTRYIKSPFLKVKEGSKNELQTSGHGQDSTSFSKNSPLDFPIVEYGQYTDDERPSHYSDVSLTTPLKKLWKGPLSASQRFHSHPETSVRKHCEHLTNKEPVITGLLPGNKFGQTSKITDDGSINLDKPQDAFSNLKLKNYNNIGCHHLPGKIPPSNPWIFHREAESFSYHGKTTKPYLLTDNSNLALYKVYQPLQPVYYSHLNSKSDPKYDGKHLDHSLYYNLQQTNFQTQQQFSKLSSANQNSDYFEGLSGPPHQFHVMGTQYPQSVPDGIRLNFQNYDEEKPQHEEISKDISEKPDRSKKRNIEHTKSEGKHGSSLKRYKTLPLASSNLLAKESLRLKGFQSKNLKEHNVEINLLEVLWSHNGSPLSIDFCKRVEDKIQKIQIEEVKEAIAYLFSNVRKYMTMKDSDIFSMKPADIVPFFKCYSSTRYESIEDLTYKYYHSGVSNYNYRKFEMLVNQMRSLRSARCYDSFFPQEYYTGTKELMKSLEEQAINISKRRINPFKNRENFILSMRKTLFLIASVINKVFLNDIDPCKFVQKQKEALEIFDEIFVKVDLACMRPAKDDQKNNKPQESFATKSAEYLAKRITIDVSRGLLGPKIEASYLILKVAQKYKKMKSFKNCPNPYKIYKAFKMKY